MARLHFLHTPLDSVDFDVCAGPPRPETAPPPAAPPAEPARPVREKAPAPAEG